MHRTLGAHRLFRAEMAAFQTHVGVVEKLFALHAPAVGMMMVAAENLHHRRYRPPFARQPRLRQIIFHEHSLAESEAARIDANQLFLLLKLVQLGDGARALDRFNTQKEAALKTPHRLRFAS